MPTFQTNLALAADSKGAAGLTDPSLYQGNLRMMVATFTIPAGLAAADIIELGPALPKGATVLPALSNIICHTDPGTSFVLDIGDKSDVDRYADGITLTVPGVVEFCSSAVPAGVTSRARLTTATELFATVMTATSLTTDTKLDFNIAYTVG